MEFPWMMFALSLLISLGGLWMWILARRRQLQEAPPCSIVLLLKAPRELDARQVAGLLSHETGRAIGAREFALHRLPRGEQPANDTVTGVTPHFAAVVDGTVFMVHNPERPYGGQVGIEHEAWLSMDILHPQAASTENYQLIARVLSHLVDGFCIALYHPPYRTCVPCTPHTAELLRSGDPVKAIFDTAHP